MSLQQGDDIASGTPADAQDAPRSSRSRRDQDHTLAATDPSSVFALKSLLYPAGATFTLFCLCLGWGEPLYGPNFLFGVLLFVLVGNFFGPAPIAPTLQDPRCLYPFSRILRRWTFVVCFLWAVFYVARLTPELNTRLYVAWAALTPLVLWGAHLVIHRTLTGPQGSHARPRRAVIVGLTDLGLMLEQRLAAEPAGMTKMMGFFEDRHSGRLPSAAVHRVLGKSASLPEYVASAGINAVYITLPTIRHPRVESLMAGLRDSTASIYFVPDLLTYDLIQPRFDMVGNLPVVAMRDTPFFGANAIAKRFMDLVFSGLLLVATSPLFLFVASGVLLTSPGPVIFKQRRYGLDGHEIVIYKFRSMTVTEDGAAHYTQVTRTDERLTPFGAFIRKYSLDELPQLLNVFTGRLSLVGPRPHAIAVNEQYRKLIPGYMLRHKVKPGITGLAQVNGARGGDDLDSMRRRIELDLNYLRNWSLTLDLDILLRTTTLIWRDQQAY
jgi:putative colanic acid biosynthesis UDP-glucose lipid carrier transferase